MSDLKNDSTTETETTPEPTPISLNGWLLVAALFLIPLLAVVFFFQCRKWYASTEQLPETPKTEITENSRLRYDPIEAQFQDALQRIRRDPENYQEAIEEIKALLIGLNSVTPTTPQDREKKHGRLEMATQLLAMLQDACNQEGETLFKQSEGKIQALLEKHYYGGALLLLDTFPERLKPSQAYTKAQLLKEQLPQQAEAAYETLLKQMGEAEAAGKLEDALHLIGQAELFHLPDISARAEKETSRLTAKLQEQDKQECASIKTHNEVIGEAFRMADDAHTAILPLRRKYDYTTALTTAKEADAALNKKLAPFGDAVHRTIQGALRRQLEEIETLQTLRAALPKAFEKCVGKELTLALRLGGTLSGTIATATGETLSLQPHPAGEKSGASLPPPVPVPLPEIAASSLLEILDNDPAVSAKARLLLCLDAGLLCEGKKFLAEIKDEKERPLLQAAFAEAEKQVLSRLKKSVEADVASLPEGRVKLIYTFLDKNQMDDWRRERGSKKNWSFENRGSTLTEGLVVRHKFNQGKTSTMTVKLCLSAAPDLKGIDETSIPWAKPLAEALKVAATTKTTSEATYTLTTQDGKSELKLHGKSLWTGENADLNAGHLDLAALSSTPGVSVLRVEIESALEALAPQLPIEE